MVWEMSSRILRLGRRSPREPSTMRAMQVRQRWGIFGGTFDPPHIGQLVAAQSALHELELDRILFVVAHVPWQKVGDRTISESSHRLAMVEAAVENEHGMQAVSLEIDRGGNSYMADTLAELSAPERDLFLVLGSDAAHGLPTWERPDEVRALAAVAVVDRPGSAGQSPPYGWEWQMVDCPLIDLSSTDLRQRIVAGAPVDHLVPDSVVSYINRNGLYR